MERRVHSGCPTIVCVFFPPDQRMKETISKSLFTYWNGLRRDRIAPKRFEIEPSCIASYLPDTFILERVDHSTARFRLAGTRICEAFGIEFRGLELAELFEDEDRATLRRAMAAVTDQGAVARLVVIADDQSGHSASFEFLVLPLMHMRETVDRFMGSVAPIDRPGWLGTIPLTRRRILSHDLIWPDGRPHAVVENMHRQTPFLPIIQEARIVRSNRRQFRVYEGGLSRADEKF